MRLRVVQGRKTTAGYVRMLKISALGTEGPRLCGNEWHFQQYNATIYNARHTLTFMKENEIHVLSHSTCSPD